MARKGAIALSVNFLVIIIIAIVILALSIFLFADVFSKVRETDVTLQRQYEEEIWRLLDTGGLVVAPLNTQTVPRGGLAKFGVGVENILDTQNFIIDVQLQNVGGCFNPQMQDGLRIPRDTINIDANDQEIFTIGVEVPKGIPACTYVFNVKVTNSTGVRYGTMQKLYVDAK